MPDSPPSTVKTFSKWDGLGSQRRQAWIGSLFVFPATLHLLIFAIFPIIAALIISLTNANLLSGANQFIGLENYRFSFLQASFRQAASNTLLFSVLSVVLGTITSLIVALGFVRPIRGLGFLKAVYYLPSISSGVAISMLFTYVYLPQNGLIATVFGWFHLPTTIDYLHDARFAMLALVGMSVVTGLGPKMILFLAGLLAIPRELHEAASMDGAGSFSQLMKVTLPMLAPTTLFVVVTSTIGAMQIFTPVYMMTKGGPDGHTDVIGYHIYTESWVDFHIGLAAAKAFLLFIALSMLAWAQFKLMKGGNAEAYSA